MGYVRGVHLLCAYIITTLPYLVLVLRAWKGFDGKGMGPPTSQAVCCLMYHSINIKIVECIKLHRLRVSTF